MKPDEKHSLGHAWYIVCQSEDLKNKPIVRELFGKPLVLFRDQSRRATALLDRCAHRNVPLSLGRIIGDQLECAYHGWRYNVEGLCTTVPTLCGLAEGKARRVPMFATHESQGYVWVYSHPGAPAQPVPYAFTGLAEPAGFSARYSRSFNGPLQAIAENILDVPHTAFLHRGLFRSQLGLKRIEAQVRRGPRSVEVEYFGETVPQGLLGRMLAPAGGVLRHIDRFILPSIAQVEYAMGSSMLQVTSVLTPRDGARTDMFTVATVRLPKMGRWVARFMVPVARYVAQQDAVMLAAQSATAAKFGGSQWASTEVDVLSAHIARLLRSLERGEVDWDAPESSDEVSERVALVL